VLLVGVQRGQSSVEYVAVVALVAIVLAVGGALVGAPSVANAVGRAMARALCLVRGGGCATVAAKPCVVGSSALKAGVTAKVVLLRVGRDSAIVRAERSDGTVEVTLLDNLGAGLKASLGAKGRLVLGDRTVAGGAMAEAHLVALLGGGRTWKLRGARAADRLVRRLEHVLAGRTASALPLVGPAIDLGQRVLRKGAHAELPDPDSRTYSGGVSAEAKALLGPLEGVHGKLGGLAGRRRGRDGATTWFVRLSGEVGAPVVAATGLDAGAGGELSLALTHDRSGRAQTLTVGAIGTLSRSAALAGLAVGTGTRGSGRRVQVSAALDLGDAADRARVDAVLRALAPGRARELPRAVRALAAAIADHAALDVTTYGEKRRGIGLDVEAGAGVGVGVAAEFSRTDQRLTGAWSRPPRGAWETRLDCLA